MIVIERAVSFETATTANGNNGGSRPERSAFGLISSYINLVNLVFVSVVAIYMTFICYHNGNKAITWHTWLCMMGYQVLMTQAILSFYPFNVLTQPYSRKTRKAVHIVLQSVGGVTAISGMIVEYVGREQSSKSHFSTTHSIIGLTSGILTVIGMLNGVSALYAMELRAHVKPIYLKFLHNFVGIAAFTLGMVALFYGYEKKIVKQQSHDEVRIGLKVLAIVTILLSLVGALQSLVRQFRSSFRI